MNTNPANNNDDTGANYVGANIRRLRDARGWTQEQLAERADLTPEAISMIERGKRTGRVETLRTIASVFGEQLTVLFRNNTTDVPRELSAFLETPMAKDVTEEEVMILATVTVPGRRMTAEAYYLALKMIRAAEQTAD